MKDSRRLWLSSTVAHGAWVQAASFSSFRQGCNTSRALLFIMYSGRKAKKKQFLDSHATFSTLVALQMMKPGSIMWLWASNLCRVMKPVYLQLTVCMLFTFNMDFSVLWDKSLFLNQLLNKEASRKLTDWYIKRGICISLLPSCLFSCPLLEGMPQHAVLSCK